MLGLYARTGTFDFLNFDDNEYVTDNPFVRDGLSATNVRAAFTRSRGGHYHPLTWLSHMADVSLFGLRPGPAHLVNAVIHSLTTALLFWLVVRVRPGRAGLAAATALLFGLHPMRIESVAWIAERKDVLALFFTVATLHTWVSHVRRPSAGRYLLVVLTLGLGLLSKPTVVTVPALLVLFERWPLGRVLSWRGQLREKLPLLVLAAASVTVTTLAQRADGAMSVQTFSVDDRVANAAVGTLAYLGKFVWPAGLGIFYPLVHYAPGVGAGAVVALALLTAAVLARARLWPELAFGWLWFLVSPLPVIGLVQFGGQAFADRWSYLPHLGLSLGCCALAARVLPARTHRPAAVLVIGTLAVVTAVNLPNWATSERLFRHTLAVSPDNFMAHTNLGNALDAAGRLDEAATHYEEAARLNPTYPEALNNLGTLLARRERMNEAAEHFRRALAIRPDLPLARYNLGLALSRLDRPVEAVTEWLRVLARAPRDARVHPSLAFVVHRILAPRCASGALSVPGPVRDEFLSALAAWRPGPEDETLRLGLSGIAGCLSR